jgi:FixJ family two-component response regulator
MTNSGFTVFLVDDDPGVLKSLTRLLRARGYEVQAFLSSEEFLSQHDSSVPGCAVVDVAMPGLDGLQLQAALSAGDQPRPVTFITGVGDIPTSVRAMQAGAVDFLTKPLNDKDLFTAITRAAENDAKARQRRSVMASVKARLATLTPRERQVLTYVIAGWLNKQIAFELGTVEKTIKVHRGRMMAKLNVRTVAELMRFVQLAEIDGPQPVDRHASFSAG